MKMKKAGMRAGTFAAAAYLVVSLLGMSGDSGFGAGDKGTAPLAASDVGAFFDEYLGKEMAELGIAGAVACVVQDGKTLFRKGYGFADLSAKIPVDPEKTLFRVGSMSKIFTWTAVMQLAEKGKLDLDRDVNEYLDFKIPATFAEPVTLRSLMAHAAGFEDIKFGQMAPSAAGLEPLGAWLKEHIPARLRPRDELPAYGNYGAALAGYIVERVSGLPYEEYLEKNLLFPLGMSRSSARQPLPPELRASLSAGYGSGPGGPFLWGEEALNPSPAGAVCSTASDIAKFMVAQLSKSGSPLLSPETQELMRRRSFSADPRVNGWAYGFTEMDLGGQRIIGHAGSSFVFNSVMMLFPEKGIGVYVATNTQAGQRFLGGGFFETRNAFVRRFFPYDPPAAAANPEDASRYAGTYRQTMGESPTTAERLFNRIMTIEIRARDGDLIAALPSGPARFLFSRPGLYLQEGTGDPLVFKAGRDGRMEAFWGAAPLTALLRDYPWEHPALLAIALGLCLFCFAAYLLSLPFIALVRRAKRAGGPEPRASARVAAWLGAASSAACLLISAFSLMSLFDSKGLYQGRLPLWGLVRILSPIESLLSGGLLVCLILVWRNRSWSLPLRLLFSVLFAACVAFGGLQILLGWKGGAI